MDEDILMSVGIVIFVIFILGLMLLYYTALIYVLYAVANFILQAPQLITQIWG